MRNIVHKTKVIDLSTARLHSNINLQNKFLYDRKGQIYYETSRKKIKFGILSVMKKEEARV